MPSAWDQTVASNQKGASQGAASTPPRSAWDQTIAAPQSTTQPAPGGSSDMWSAFKHHVGSNVYGAGQLLVNGASALVHKIEPGSDLDKDTAAMAARANADLQDREKKYQASVPTNAASVTGATAGEIAPFLLSGPARVMDAAGDAASATARFLGLGGKTASNIARGAAHGATSATIAPVTQDGDYWSQKGNQVATGAGVGAVVPPAISAVKGTVNQVRAAVAPFTNPQSVIAPTLSKMAPGLSTDAIVRTLRNPQNFVPGSIPTTAQVLQTPEAAMLEKAIANTPEGKIATTTRQNQNNAARLDYLGKYAGTDDALVQAIAQRRQNAQPMTSTLQAAAPIDASPIVQHLDSIASSGLGTDPVIRSAIVDARRILTDQGSAGENGGLFVKPDILDGIRQNVRGFLAKNSSNGAVSSRQEAALEPLKDTITDTIDGGIPGYRDYLAAYRSDSVPINTMEQLQGIRSSIDSRALNPSGDPALTLSLAQKAARDVDRAKYPISPEADDAVNNVLSDMQRESISNSVRTPGSDTNLNGQAAPWLARQLYGDAFNGKPGVAATGLGAALGGGLGYLAGNGFGPLAGEMVGTGGSAAGGYLASKVANAGASRVNGALADALLNPDVAADILQQQSGPKFRAQALADFLSKTPVLGPYVSQPSN